MKLQLFNTLSGTTDAVFAADGASLRMYACGPTVYDYGHIGNFRTFLHIDILRRTLLLSGVRVNHVMNITDVDDKIIRNAAEAKLSLDEYTAKYTQAFLEDLDALGIQRPEHMPRATEHIAEMVTLIQTLAGRGLAYKTEDGSWYFSIAKFPAYGQLSKKDFEGIEDGARVDVDEYEKDTARDFALWKAPKPGEHHWDTALGPGRPGWHIECSAMAMQLLGNSFDLHAGGEDLMFPHHENEIAQSECATGVQFARHWMHVRFLLVEGRKMSKSEGNFYTLRDLLLKGYKVGAIRYLLVSVPYHHQMNFTFDGLADATVAVEKLRTFDARLNAVTCTGADSTAWAERVAQADSEFTAALEDDLNTARALAPVFELLRFCNGHLDKTGNTASAGDIAATLALLEKFDSIFSILEDRDAETTRTALAWAEADGRADEASADLVSSMAFTDAAIDALVAERTEAKKTRNFARADAIRKELAEKNILIEDSKDGVRWKRR
ncbi:MAG TPA: cysteine--tRNA ligase [Acidobacteriaceae bacterium]|nr:cysteine--tRNA ligase [Acidobacteriaceae bacterium]